MSDSPWLTPGAKPSPYHAATAVASSPHAVTAPVVTGPQISGLQKNPNGTASLVIGIVVLAGAAIPFTNTVTFVTFLLPLILGIVSVRRPNAVKRAAVGGIATSSAAVIVAIILIAVYNAIFFSS